MKVFTLRIECESAAFDGISALEVSRILRDLGADIATTCNELGDDDGETLLDINGNRCGSWSFTEEQPK